MSNDKQNLGSISGMIKAGIIKRTDKGMFIDEDRVLIDPGFNRRREGAKLEASIEVLAEFLIDDKKAAEGKKALKELADAIPQLEVYPDGNGNVIVVEGHRRKRSFGKLRARGYPIPQVPIKPFTGDSLARKARIASSNNQEALDPLELGDLYLDMEQNDGLNQEQIAKMCGKTRQHVEQMLRLAKEATAEVRQQIDAGIIAAGTAVAIVRQHKEGASQVIAEQHEQAKAQGKSKVTAGTIKKAAARPLTPSVPKVLANDLAVAGNRLVRELGDDVKALLERYRAGESGLGDQTVSLSIRSINALLVSVSLVNEAQAEAERKAAAQEAA